MNLWRRLQSIDTLHCQKEISWRENLESLSQEFRCIYHPHIRKHFDNFFVLPERVRNSVQFCHAKHFFHPLAERLLLEYFSIYLNCALRMLFL